MHPQKFVNFYLCLIFTFTLFCIFLLFSSYAYIFDFQLWHYINGWPTMLGNVTWPLKRIAERLPWCYGAAIVRQHTNITFYAFFEKNCQQVVNCSLPPWKKTLLKFYYREKMPQEKCSKGAPALGELPLRIKATPQEV